VFALAILVPVVWRMAQDRNSAGAFRLTALDTLILCYGALTVVQMLPHESPTHSARRAFLFLIDIALPYFVASRACINRRALVDVLASFCLACALLTPLALFEVVSGWLLYAGIGDHWGIPRSLGYETRGGFLRAQASSGHSLALGNLLAIGFGFWLYLRTQPGVKRRSPLVIIWLWLGLLAAASRGPWLAGLTALFVFIAVGPSGAARLVKAFLIAIPVAGAVLLSPIGSHVIDRLPFVGTIGAENVAYRQLILAVSWEFIKENPLLGNPMVVGRLEALRQGEGIIDMVNGYVTIVLFHGVIGLSLWLGFVLGCAGKAYRMTRLNATRDADLSLLGAALIACIVAFLSMTGTGGVGPTVEKILFVVAGLAVSYGSVNRAVQIGPGAPAVHGFRRKSMPG
jgi:O-antigen ligase